MHSGNGFVRPGVGFYPIPDDRVPVISARELACDQRVRFVLEQAIGDVSDALFEKANVRLAFIPQDSTLDCVSSSVCESARKAFVERQVEQYRPLNVVVPENSVDYEILAERIDRFWPVRCERRAFEGCGGRLLSAATVRVGNDLYVLPLVQPVSENPLRFEVSNALSYVRDVLTMTGSAALGRVRSTFAGR